MSIKIRYFAILKEVVGQTEQNLEILVPMTVAQVWQQATINLPIPNNVLAAVNMEYVSFEHLVMDGDEVAFFPPVTGG